MSDARIKTVCAHGDPYCPCQDGLGDACHYEWSGDSPPMPCAHCLPVPVRSLPAPVEPPQAGVPTMNLLETP